VSLPFNGEEHRQIYLTFSVYFRDFIDTSIYGGIEIKHIVGYEQNSLVTLFNVLGSDKGTEWCLIDEGVPHCYGIEYFRLFQELQDREFNLLEIGLDNVSKLSGCPQDAPSLRAWRKFFRKANIYGYDINDFTFSTKRRLLYFRAIKRHVTT